MGLSIDMHVTCDSLFSCRTTEMVRVPVGTSIVSGLVITNDALPPGWGFSTRFNTRLCPVCLDRDKKLTDERIAAQQRKG